MVTKKKKFCDHFLKTFMVENNSYIYVYDFPQNFFSMCQGTYSTIPDPSKNQSVKLKEEVNQSDAIATLEKYLLPTYFDHGRKFRQVVPLTSYSPALSSFNQPRRMAVEDQISNRHRGFGRHLKFSKYRR